MYIERRETIMGVRDGRKVGSIWGGRRVSCNRRISRIRILERAGMIRQGCWKIGGSKMKFWGDEVVGDGRVRVGPWE